MPCPRLALLHLLLLVGLRAVRGHFSFFHAPSQIACDIMAGEGANWLAMPLLEDQPFEEWWFHGQVGCQHNAQDTFKLPAGGAVQAVMSSRIQFVPEPWGIPTGSFSPPDPDYVLSHEEWGHGPKSRGNQLDGSHNIHAYSRNDTSGCAWGIAYKSEATEVKPEDFVIFSVIHDCPKRQRETMEVPRLPACPNDKCICAWFWIPKNSGLKNFYMTPFVCEVTGDVGDSPVDVEHAIPPRRCLDPNNCNFGPRQPMYWLGDSEQVNMPESTNQSPHFSIRYGFREGAQHDIFVATNPRRDAVPGFPEAESCSVIDSVNDGTPAPSRLTETATQFLLRSPDCRCTAELKHGRLRVMEGGQVLWQEHLSEFGPDIVVADDRYKASQSYFPKSQGPFRLDLSNECYLYLSDSLGVVLWESMFSSPWHCERIVNSFLGYDPDPWGIQPPLQLP